MTDSRERETDREREATERNKQPTEITSIRGGDTLSRGGDTTKLLNARGWLARVNPEYTYDLVTFLS
jgi:hypothetical protein